MQGVEKHKLPADVEWPALIREMRFRLKLKQEGLAQTLNVSQAAVSQWERGICDPPEALIAHLEQLLEDAGLLGASKELEASVIHSPNLCGLLRFVKGDFILEQQSRAGFEVFPGFTPDDLGRSIWGRLGPQVDETYQRLVAEGAFEGRLRAAVIKSKAFVAGEAFLGVSTYIPFQKTCGEWVLRAEVRLVDPGEPDAANSDTWPEYFFDRV